MEKKTMSTADGTAAGSLTISESIYRKKVGVKILNKVREAGAVGVPATYTSLGWVEKVKVKIPSLEAKYMCFVPEHTIGAADEKLTSSKLLEISAHYRHGDMARRLSDGSVKPAVMRHFFVKPEDCGQEIIANVELQKKVNLINNEETLIINIHKSSEEVATRELRLGAPSFPGKEKEEVSIPGSNLVVAFRKVKQLTPKVQPLTPRIEPLTPKVEKLTPAQTKVSPADGLKKIILPNGKKKFVLQK